jgi:hypothetical protein
MILGLLLGSFSFKLRPFVPVSSQATARCTLAEKALQNATSEVLRGPDCVEPWRRFRWPKRGRKMMVFWRGNHPQMISDGLIYLILSELLEFLLKWADQPLRSGKREKIWIWARKNGDFADFEACEIGIPRDWTVQKLGYPQENSKYRSGLTRVGLVWPYKNVGIRQTWCWLMCGTGSQLTGLLSPEFLDLHHIHGWSYLHWVCIGHLGGPKEPGQQPLLFWSNVSNSVQILLLW